MASCSACFSGILHLVDGEQLDHEKNSDVLNSKNKVDKIDQKHYSDVVNAHVFTDDEMDKRREMKTLDDKQKLECEKKRVCKGFRISSDRIKVCHVK